MVDWIESSRDGTKKFEGKVYCRLDNHWDPLGTLCDQLSLVVHRFDLLWQRVHLRKGQLSIPLRIKESNLTPLQPPPQKQKKTGPPNEKIQLFCFFFVVVFVLRSELLGGVDLSTARSPLRELRERLRPRGARVAGHKDSGGLWVWVEPEVTIQLVVSTRKILVKLDHFPRVRGEIKKYLKRPPSYRTWVVSLHSWWITWLFQDGLSAKFKFCKVILRSSFLVSLPVLTSNSCRLVLRSNLIDWQQTTISSHSEKS